MQIRKHNGIGAKQLRQPFYFTQWCYCPGCKHVQHYEHFKVVKPVVYDEDKSWDDVSDPSKDEDVPW